MAAGCVFLLIAAVGFLLDRPTIALLGSLEAVLPVTTAALPDVLAPVG